MADSGKTLSDVDSTAAMEMNITQSSTVVHDLGVLLDSELTINMHVNKVTPTCFYQRRRLREIRRIVRQDHTAHQLAHAFVRSRLDYVNSSLSMVNRWRRSLHYSEFKTPLHARLNMNN